MTTHPNILLITTDEERYGLPTPDGSSLPALGGSARAVAFSRVVVHCGSAVEMERGDG